MYPSSISRSCSFRTSLPRAFIPILWYAVFGVISGTGAGVISGSGVFPLIIRIVGLLSSALSTTAVGVTTGSGVTDGAAVLWTVTANTVVI